MKTKKILMLASFILAVCAAMFFSCDIPLALGERLDINGPVVEFTSPAARKAVPPVFTVQGKAADGSGIDRLLLKVEYNNSPFPKQWRYSSSGWEISDNYGGSWSPLSGALWNGSDTNAEWSIPVDMNMGSVAPKVGEYLFIVQAWDSGGFTDANSYKTLVLIVDDDLPLVDVSEPYLYRYNDADLTNPASALSKLDVILDTDPDKTDPSFIGKFITQSFKLQWQIEDSYDVWSIDLRFYKKGEYIDGAEWTDLPDTYIYSYKKNDLIPPEIPDRQETLRPNGTITVPALEGAIQRGYYDGGEWELKNPISEKETIQVVAACYDSAGHPNQEKVLGYFVYWPAADYPWIAYNDGMEPPATAPIPINNVFMIYPGRNINANAFHAHGLKEVMFSLYDVDVVENATGTSITSYTVHSTPREDFTNVRVFNTPRGSGYSTQFKWTFTPPPRSGYFVVKAIAYSEHRESVEYQALFRVQDITFPNFPEEPKPAAGKPLYESIAANNTFTISGIVSDATQITSLTMVWINPESRNYAAMSQLQYLRDQAYQGWSDAKGLALGATKLEVAVPRDPDDPPPNPPYPYDENNPNRLWRIPLSNQRLDPATNRQLYNYSITVNLADLNIGTGTYNSPTVIRNQQPLTSQVFLLMAENPQGKTEIFTYAPQGDTLSPKVDITRVDVVKTSGTIQYIPNSTQVVDQFANNDRINIYGTWEEDSAAYLNPQTYFKPKMEVEVNAADIVLTNVTVNQTNPSNANGGGSTSGTWSAFIVVGAGQLSSDSLKDTLVVNAKVDDFGGNNAEKGCSWLIQTDYLRFMRVSSEMADGTYRQFNSGTDSANPTDSNYYPQKIRFFLEFNKPVVLDNPANIPVLNLNTGKQATYVYSNTLNTRQYFEYEIGAGDNTTPPAYLNVTGIATAIAWNANNYPLIWRRGSGDTLEVIRVTNVNTHDGTTILQAGGYRVRRLPMTAASNDPDYPFTLGAGKNITIDTTPPAAQYITANTTQGYYTTGAEIHITAKFSKPVKIGAVLPRLALQVTNTSPAYTTAYTDNDNSSKVRVNGDEITFVYTVKAGDITGAQNAPVVLSVTGQSGGDITDLAGNLLPTSGTGSIANVLLINRTLTGIYIDAIAPQTPVLRVLPSNTAAANDTNVVKSTVVAVVNEGRSNQANRDLKNLYNENLWLAVESLDQSVSELYRLEYSINEGTSWVTFNNNTNTPIQLTQPGDYKFIARQTDRAGNVSATSSLVSFTWDPGRLISRISSTSANGTYTHNTGRNLINITVTFRKPLTFTTASPEIQLNAQNSGANKTVTGSGTGTSLSFTYNVINGDGIPGAALLDVLDISGFTNVRDSDNVEVSALLNNILPQAGQEALLKENKSIRVETGNLTRSGNPSIKFEEDTSGGWTQGIQADGSYWTTLHIVFNHAIYKGSGTITIEQKDAVGAGTGGGYRIPAVLTESQYNRFRSVPNINTYYTKGTNGYIYDSGTPANSRSDTSAKYVLDYQYNPNSAVTTANNHFQGDTPIPSTFFTNFKAAETISFNISAQAVETSGNILKVRLTGSNAPQVPGATYVVTYSPGLVIDSLGNNSPAQTTVGEDVTLGGVARPFVRIKKMQDTINVRQTANTTTPSFTAVQPFYAYVRMDSRTPGSAIYYRAQPNQYNETAVNWSNTGNPPTASTATYPADTVTEVQYTTPYSGDNLYGIRIGNNTYGGYKWFVRADARLGANNNSTESHEVAYRTAITYRLMGAADGNNSTDMANPIGNAAGTTAQRRIYDGDQIWIRGGDSIGSSSIPGFPFTWEDDFTDLKDSQKRAGIRLMTKVNNTTHTGGGNQNQLWNSQWQFLTWDINATAYVDFILGRDQNYNEVDAQNGVNTQFYPSLNEAEVWQYGPRYWAVQRAGWSALKYQYPIFPGEHRWVNTGTNLPSTDNPVNYANAFKSRPSAGTNPTTGWSVTYPNPNTNN